jgi:hypothetical protein
MEDIQDLKPSPVTETIDDSHSSPSSPRLKQDHGVTLIPRPSDDPRDPLVSAIPLSLSPTSNLLGQNWPLAKKIGIVACLSFAVFCGFVAPLAGQLNLKSQSILYKQSTTHIAYQVSFHQIFISHNG